MDPIDLNQLTMSELDLLDSSLTAAWYALMYICKDKSDTRWGIKGRFTMPEFAMQMSEMVTEIHRIKQAAEKAE